MELALQLALEMPPALPEDLAQRIHDAQYSGNLSDCAAAVLGLLVDHPQGPRAGRAKALSIAAMQAIWTRQGSYVWSDRIVKSSVKELVEDHLVPVGSSRTSNCSGYFFPVNIEDLEAAERPIRAEIISLAKRLRAINPHSDFARHIAGQQELAPSSTEQ